MTRIDWDSLSLPFEAGISQVVLYLDDVVVPWNGIISIDTDDDSSIDTSNYYDGSRHRLSQRPGDFYASVQAYTYPEEFEAYDGLSDGYALQPKKRFGLSYRVERGEDDYEIHLIYNAQVSPSAKNWKTEDNTPDSSIFSWDMAMNTEPVPGAIPSSHMFVDTRTAHKTPLRRLEDILYGTPSMDARLPKPDELVDLFETYTDFTVVYNEDGTYTVIGPDYMVENDTEDTFVVSSPTLFFAPTPLFDPEDVYLVSSRKRQGGF